MIEALRRKIRLTLYGRDWAFTELYFDLYQEEIEIKRLGSNLNLLLKNNNVSQNPRYFEKIKTLINLNSEIKAHFQMMILKCRIFKIPWATGKFPDLSKELVKTYSELIEDSIEQSRSLRLKILEMQNNQSPESNMIEIEKELELLKSIDKNQTNSFLVTEKNSIDQLTSKLKEQLYDSSDEKQKELSINQIKQIFAMLIDIVKTTKPELEKMKPISDSIDKAISNKEYALEQVEAIYRATEK